MNQRQRYIDECVRLRVARRRNQITDHEYQDQLFATGRECCDALLEPVEELVTMFREIKKQTGLLLDKGI